MASATANMDGLRAYLRELRTGRKVTQDQLAKAMKLSRRALIDWETGERQEIKAGPLIRAMRFFGVPLDHVERLIDTAATVEEGQLLAQSWLNQQQVQEIDELVRLDDQDALDVIDQMQEQLNRLRHRLSQ